MDLLSRGAFSVLSTLFSSLSLVRNKTTGKQKKLHVAWEKRKVLAVVEFPSKNLKPPGKALRRWNIYETFFSPNAHSSGIAFCSLNLFLYLLNETLNAFGFFLDGNPFHCWCGWCLKWVCCPLLVLVCRPYSSVAVETLCGAATMFLPSAKVTRMSNNNWHAHRVYAEQVAVESTDVVWWCDCLSQILRGFVLLASVLSAVAT